LAVGIGEPRRGGGKFKGPILIGLSSLTGWAVEILQKSWGFVTEAGGGRQREGGGEVQRWLLHAPPLRKLYSKGGYRWGRWRGMGNGEQRVEGAQRFRRIVRSEEGPSGGQNGEVLIKQHTACDARCNGKLAIFETPGRTRMVRNGM